LFSQPDPLPPPEMDKEYAYAKLGLVKRALWLHCPQNWKSLQTNIFGENTSNRRSMCRQSFYHKVSLIRTYHYHTTSYQNYVHYYYVVSCVTLVYHLKEYAYALYLTLLWL